jgi:predicted house-cleaning noncanonical NTP pyrophosphatase (MazG superfamily)
MPQYEKLVRDKIPDIIRANGQEPVVRKLIGFEFVAGLRYKLYEEAKELAKAPIRLDVVNETADLKEVYDAFVKKLDIVVPAATPQVRVGGVEMMQQLRTNLVVCAVDIATAPTCAETVQAMSSFEQVYDLFLDCWRLSPEEIVYRQAKKIEKAGGFELGLYLVDVRPR